jgi:hypothetical protein
VAVRPRFDPAMNFVAARSFTYNGEPYEAGQPFNKEGLAPFKLNTLYGSRAINQAPDGQAETAADPVVLTQTRPGYFEITAPWLDEPEKIRGKVNAETRATELREAGEPLDYRGVAIEESGGGWYTVTAEWVEEPEKVQGLDAAKARANALREAGPPPEHYAMVEVSPGENDTFLVSAPWQETETFATSDEAEARAQQVREAGPPEGFDPEKAEEERAARAAEAERLRAEHEAALAEQQRKAAYAALVTISETTEGDVTSYSVSAPDGDPEAFDDEAKAKARFEELREAGPPEGWTAPASE